MPKLHALTLAALALIAPTLVTACDPAPELVDELEFREGVNGEFESLGYAVKQLNNCVSAERPVTVGLELDHVWPDETQSFYVTISSTAPIDQIDCILAVLEANPS